jgi:hypothetical protein
VKEALLLSTKEAKNFSPERRTGGRSHGPEYQSFFATFWSQKVVLPRPNH